MKKLFVTCLSALTLLGVAGCGASYSDKVLPADLGVTVHAVGGWGEWQGTNGNKMNPTSVKAVSEISKDLADKLAGKSLKYLYTLDITVPEKDSGWKAKYVDKDGKEVEVDGALTLKAIECSYNAAEEVYVSDQWIPDPADQGHAAHVEALTDNLFFPPYQKEEDEHGLSWASNPVIMSGVGRYHFVVAKYTTPSSATAIGFGFGLVKVELK